MYDEFALEDGKKMENDEHLMESSHAVNAYRYGRKRVTHEW